MKVAPKVSKNDRREYSKKTYNKINNKIGKIGKPQGVAKKGKLRCTVLSKNKIQCKRYALPGEKACRYHLLPQWDSEETTYLQSFFSITPRDIQRYLSYFIDRDVHFGLYRCYLPLHFRSILEKEWETLRSTPIKNGLIELIFEFFVGGWVAETQREYIRKGIEWRLNRFTKMVRAIISSTSHWTKLVCKNIERDHEKVTLQKLINEIYLHKISRFSYRVIKAIPREHLRKWKNTDDRDDCRADIFLVYFLMLLKKKGVIKALDNVDMSFDIFSLKVKKSIVVGCDFKNDTDT